MSEVLKDVFVSEQWLAGIDPHGPEVATALAHIRLQETSSTSDESGVILQELPLTGLLSLRGDANDASLEPTLKKALKLSLPSTLQSDTNDQASIRWMTPDEWLISASVDKLLTIEQDLRQGVTGSMAVVNVTGGYTVLHLAGKHALDVLKKSTPYDVHPSNFPPGKVVNTTFAKTQATLRALDEGYELIVRRSFVDYAWMWLHVAAEEYGLSVTV